MKRLLKKIFWLQAVINLMGAVSPELAFDALWYHLPIARLIAERGWWGVIPGGLLYTSGVPRLVDYLYGVLIWLGKSMGMYSPEILAKVAHWGFGLLSVWMILKIAKRYVSEEVGWIAAIVWYSSLVVGWQSMVAYVDLARSFSVLVGVWFLLEWLEKNRKYCWIFAGMAFGLAYSTKIISGFDAIFVGMFVLVVSKMKRWRGVLGLWSIVAIFGLIWGYVNVYNGYHFFYPFYGFNTYMPVNFSLRYSHIFSPLMYFWHPKFRTGPVHIIMLILSYKTLAENRTTRYLGVIVFGLFASWWFAPAELWKGDGRYMLPLLAVASAYLVTSWDKRGERVRGVYLMLAVLSGLVGIVYRGSANMKFIPYITREQSKEEFLLEHLDLKGSDWFDLRGELKEIVGEQRYLVYGIHNTYYLPGNFDHESWMDPDYCYRYVLVRGDNVRGDREYKLINNWKETNSRVYEDIGCVRPDHL